MDLQTGLNVLRRHEKLALHSFNKNKAYYHVAKRVLDVILATLILIVIFPLLILISVLIVLDYPGPVLFSQQRVGARRVGRHGSDRWCRDIFTLYKFRTMRPDADPAIHQAYVKAFIHNDQEAMAQLQGGVTQTRKLLSDPRITRIGRLLRKCSLDEFPQFWNVIIGNMSLVGPRPAIPYELEEYQPWHYCRFEAKPGITGLWQVTARSSADFDEMVRLDLQYIEKQSLWLDLVILLKTPWVVLKCKGAA